MTAVFDILLEIGDYYPDPDPDTMVAFYGRQPHLLQRLFRRKFVSASSGAQRNTTTVSMHFVTEKFANVYNFSTVTHPLMFTSGPFHRKVN